jgi:TatD DNase family protein
MVWVDTHCHLQLDGRPPGVLLERAPDVDWLVAPGVDAASSEASADLARRHPGRVLATAGLHPHEAGRWPEEEARIVELAGSAAAIGETGLDHYRDLAPRPAQRGAFRAHLELAGALGKPVIVHCRDAFAEVHEMLAEADLAGDVVLHCWTGGPRWSRRFAELGVTFSFAGPVAFETGDTVRRGAEVIPPDRVMVETDTPYLAPPPHRGQQNEPAWVALVGGALAGVWGMDVADVAASTSARARAVFGVDP